MANELDLREVKVTVEINGRLTTYTDLKITATGTKYANSLQNSAQITISNIKKSDIDYILSETSPFNLNRTPKVISLFGGRKSYGTTLIYQGNVVAAVISQPPDVTLTLKCLTGNFLKGSVLSRFQPGTVSLDVIAKGIAQDTKTILNFQATNKNITNYTFSGAATDQLDLLNSAGGYNAFIDDNILVVKDGGVPITGASRVLDADSGMVGIPETTEQGIRVTYLLDNVSRLGGALDLKSAVYPSVNGKYIIYKLSFNITNRDVPFYYVAEGARLL